jgi:putative DNA primase/helicase
MSQVDQAARGNWRHILMSLGIHEKYLVNRHGPCPHCGGHDRFRWDNKENRGDYYCSGCGAGDGFSLAMKVTGKSFRDIAEHIAQLMGTTNEFERRGKGMEETQQRDQMRRVWQGSWEPSTDTPVGRYLDFRVGCLWPSGAIRELCLPNKGWYMVAKITDPAGAKAVNLHLTAITYEGRQKNISPAKRVMPGKLPPGSAIRLGPIKPVMGVAEGIETAISAAIMFDMPVWACVNGTLLSQWIPPEGCESVTVFGDNDANFAGQAKAYHLANRLELQYKRRVNVMIPPAVGMDWNDHHHDTWSKPGSHLRLVK